MHTYASMYTETEFLVIYDIFNNLYLELYTYTTSSTFRINGFYKEYFTRAVSVTFLYWIYSFILDSKTFIHIF